MVVAIRSKIGKSLHGICIIKKGSFPSASFSRRSFGSSGRSSCGYYFIPEENVTLEGENEHDYRRNQKCYCGYIRLCRT